MFALYTVSASPLSIGITASGWWPQGQEQGHRDGKGGKGHESPSYGACGPEISMLPTLGGGDEPLKGGGRYEEREEGERNHQLCG